MLNKGGEHGQLTMGSVVELYRTGGVDLNKSKLLRQAVLRVRHVRRVPQCGGLSSIGQAVWTWIRASSRGRWCFM